MGEPYTVATLLRSSPYGAGYTERFGYVVVARTGTAGRLEPEILSPVLDSGADALAYIEWLEDHGEGPPSLTAEEWWGVYRYGDRIEQIAR